MLALTSVKITNFCDILFSFNIEKKLGCQSNDLKAKIFTISSKPTFDLSTPFSDAILKHR